MPQTRLQDVGPQAGLHYLLSLEMICVLLLGALALMSPAAKGHGFCTKISNVPMGCLLCAALHKAVAVLMQEIRHL